MPARPSLPRPLLLPETLRCTDSRQDIVMSQSLHLMTILSIRRKRGWAATASLALQVHVKRRVHPDERQSRAPRQG